MDSCVGVGRVITVYGSMVMEIFPKELLCLKRLSFYISLFSTEAHTKFPEGKGIRKLP